MPISQKPAHEIRLGSIRATIWANQYGEINRHTVKLSRSYKDRDGDTWKTTESFGHDDLPKVMLAVQKAYEWIFTASSSG